MAPDAQPPLPPVDLEAIEAPAAVWLSLRDRGMSEGETAEFMRWLQQDPRHAEVFAELDATWKTFNRLGATRPAGVVEPDADFLAPRVRARSRQPWVAATLAAVAALAVAYAGFQWLTPAWPMAETDIGAFRKMDLADGSTVQLNTDSAIEVRYTEAERRVRLVRGEAHFTVAKNPRRPFIVSAGTVAVRAVGTAFNVRLRAQGVEVLVTEGKVSVAPVAPGSTEHGAGGAGVSPTLLAAGERVLIPASAAPLVTMVTPLEVERTLAWQERRLEFESTPLSEVVAEFNRYNRHKLVIADPALQGRRFGGTFRADGYEPFVRLLEANFGVAVERTEGTTLLRLAP